MNPLIKLKHAIELMFVKFKHQQGFFYKGKYFPFFYNMYNATWKNERRYEIPIFIKEIEDYGKEDILEIGNVLKHYANVNHDVVDLYEKADGVTNEDICFFTPHERYGLIISISTMEHIDYRGIALAFENIRGLLKPNGKFIFSFLTGYSLALEEQLTSECVVLHEIKLDDKSIRIGNNLFIGEIKR